MANQPNESNVSLLSPAEKAARRQRLAALDPMLQFFVYEHLPETLQVASLPFCELADWLVEAFPRNPERTVALRKLLEAKDCAVRALLYKAVVQSLVNPPGRI